MINVFKSELLKLLTIRSTYFISGFLLLLTAFISTYVFGYKHNIGIAVDQSYLSQTIYSMLGFAAIFITITAILIVAHEYRHNTIAYTVISARRRYQIFAAKTAVALLYASVISLLVICVTVAGVYFGLSLADKTIPTQDLSLTSQSLQWLVYIWGYALVGLIIAFIVRGLVWSIVLYFVVPSIEGIISLLLKDNGKFLPFRALDATAATSIGAVPGSPNLSHSSAIYLTIAYILVFGVIACYLFIKRDATKN